MTPESPTAQSGPSDRAIAQAFREATENGVSYAPTWLMRRAIEIDQETPPAGARDAVTDEIAGVRDTLIVAANNPVSHGGIAGLRRLMHDQAERLRALTGKADGGELKTMGMVRDRFNLPNQPATGARED